MTRFSETLGRFARGARRWWAGQRQPRKRSDGRLRHERLRRPEPLEERALLSIGGPGSHEPSYLVPEQFVFESGGYLTGPSSARPLDIALGYLSAHADRFGLAAEDLSGVIVTDQYSDPDTAMTHIYLRQEFNSLEVVNANMNVNVTADGRILSIGGGFVPGLGRLESTTAVASAPAISAEQAVQRAAVGLGLTTDAAPTTVLAGPQGIARAGALSDSDLSLDPIPTKLYYVATPGGVQLAWQVVMRTPDQQHWYDVSVDASSGELLLTNDWVNEASYDVFARPTDTLPGAEDPADGPRTLVTDPQDPTASPYGWHDTNGSPGAEYTDTRGNNVFAQEDRDANDTGGYRPSGGAGLNFDFPLDLSQSPITNQDAAITNLFYWNNILHDIHYRYGFNEVAGNFQQTNYTGQGLGNDPVQADAQDGSGTDNANFMTPPDGTAPRMQMYNFTYTSPNRDGDFENMVIVHEYGHGVSIRLVGGPSNVNSMSATQSGGMGEGYGDWWGLMFTQKSTDTQMASYPVGTWVLGQAPNGPGIRRYPYCFDKTVDPLTYGWYNTSNEVHDTGEIWCSTLWDLNWLLIDKYGYNPDIAGGYTGSGSAGNIVALQLVMDSLKIMPVNPTFLQGRDALLQADQALTGGANRYQIWTAFARRGMGYSAYDGGSPNATTVTEAFDLPPGLLNPSVLTHVPSGVSTTPLSSIEFQFSKAMDTLSFAVADDVASFTGPGGVNLISQISGFHWVDDDTLRVTFNAQTTDGEYTMVIGPQILAGDDHHAMDQDGDGTAGELTQDQYTAHFRYDSLVLQVDSSIPADGSFVQLPFTSRTLHLNERYDSATVAASDLTLSQGHASDVTLVDFQTVTFTLEGATSEGPLTASIAAGAITDRFGNPNAAYSGIFQRDYGVVPLPTTFQAERPQGSLIYTSKDPVDGIVGPVGDVDAFTVVLDAGQTIAVSVTPKDTSLQPWVRVYDPANVLEGSALAGGGGQEALLQAVPAASAGTYTIRVGGAIGTTGAYTVHVILNAAAEAEQHGGPTDNDRATAQDINASFLDLGGGMRRGAVLGKTDAALADWYSFHLDAGESVTLGLKGKTATTGVDVKLYDTAGNLVTQGVTAGNTVDKVIDGFVAPQTGTYYASISGTVTEYALVVTAGAAFDLGGNQTPDKAQDISLNDAVLGAMGTGAGGTPLIFAVEWQDPTPTTIDTIDPQTGAILKQFSSPATPTTNPFGLNLAFDGTRLFYNAGSFSGNNTIYVLNGSDGTVLGSFTATQALSVLGLGYLGGKLYVMDDTSSDIDIYDAQTFAYVKSIPAPTAGLTGFSGDDAHSYLYAVDQVGHTIYRLDPATGATLKTGPSGLTSEQGMAVMGDELFISNTGGSGSAIQEIWVYDANTFSTLRHFTLPISTEIAGLGGDGVYATFTPGFAPLLPASGGALSAAGPGAVSAYAKAAQHQPAGTTVGGATPAHAGVDPPAPTSDYYSIRVTAGDELIITTQTPFDGPGEIVNTLDPRIELYDPVGLLVASDDNSAPDGRNARLTYTAAAAGTYQVAVVATGSGIYVLKVSGARDSLPDFVVTPPTIPANEVRLLAAPTSFTAAFSVPVNWATVQAADLKIDGRAAGSFSFPANDNNTVVWGTLSGPFGEGWHTVEIAGDAIRDIHNQPLGAYQGRFYVDVTPPRVVGSSVQEGDVRPVGSLTCTATFSEALKDASLDPTDWTLHGIALNVDYTAASWNYDSATSVLTLNYANLPDDKYTLTLYSGDGKFEDTVGRDLDGEPLTWPIPPNKSGNGVDGGNFYVNFWLDGPDPRPFPVPLTAADPLGGLVYDRTAPAAWIAATSDTDRFTLELDAGQTITVIVDPDTSLRPVVTLYDSGNNPIGAATAAAAGQDAILQTIPVTSSGTYTIVVGAAGGTTGAYTVRIALNAAAELESFHGSGNNSRATAQNIDASFVDLGGDVTRGAVFGKGDPPAGTLPNEIEPNNSAATANSAVANFTAYSGNFYQLGLKGQIATSTDADWYKIGALDVGDVISISESGTPAARGTLADTYVYLYRYNAGSPALVISDDQSGPGNDSLIYRYTISAADTYYVVADAYSTYTGTYDLGILLENSGTAPLTGGTVTAESEPNDAVGTATDASSSWRAVGYVSTTSASITAGDVDYSAYQFTAGDLVTLDIHSTGTMRPRAWLRSASDVIIASEDGTSVGPTTDSWLYCYIIPTTGTYYVEAGAYTGTGTYAANVYLSARTAPPAPTPGEDWYSFHLDYGQPATIVAKAQSGDIDLEVYSDTGVRLAVGVEGAANVDEVIGELRALTTGQYYARVTGPVTDYRLIVARRAVFDLEPNNPAGAAQDISPVAKVLGAVTASGAAGDDWYALRVTAGDQLTLQTRTPAGKSGEFVNTLDPAIELYDPGGGLVGSDDNSAGDGRNALLTYTASTAGTYTVRVLATAGTGEYLLTADGATGFPAPFMVTATTPADGSRVGVAGLTTLTVDFSQNILLTTLDAADLMIDGSPAGTVEVIDGNTVTWKNLPAVTGEGWHNFSIAAGAILDVRGSQVAAFSGRFYLDVTSPRVISSSVQEGDVLPSGSLTYNVRFSEEMQAANLDLTDWTLHGIANNADYAPATWSYNPTTSILTLNYSALPEDRYTLTLLSADGRLEDLAGNNLDGEAVSWPIPPSVSGNGVEGGNFAVNFWLVKADDPAGSLVYKTWTIDSIATVGESDNFKLNLDPGQTLTVIVDPAASLRPSVSILNPSGGTIATTTPATAGIDAVLQTAAIATGGSHRIVVSGAASTTGTYTLLVIFNSAAEAENFNGAANDTRATAQDLTTSFLDLGHGVTRAAVSGKSDRQIGLLPAEIEPNNTAATANAASANFTAYAGNLYHLGLKGQVSTSSDADWYKLGALDVGDIITISESGVASSRGTLSDTYLYLYRYNNGSPLMVTSDDDSGPSVDSLIYRYSITTADTYYVVADAYSSYTGTYDLGILLENSGATPLTGGSVTTETEPNDTVATATDASSSWRAVQYRSTTTANITSGDVDYYAFQFSAGDLVTINIDSTSTLYACVWLRNASDAVLALEDGTSYGFSPDSWLYSYVIPTTGTYYVEAGAYSGTGTYTANVYLSARTAPPPASTGEDWYRFSLTAGQTVTLAAKGDSGDIDLTLYNDAGTLLAMGVEDAANLDELIQNYSVSAAGNYYARIVGAVTDYRLVVTRNADFDMEPNQPLSAAEDISPAVGALGAISVSGAAGDDWYAFHATAGHAFVLSTATPLAGTVQFLNRLDPAIELYDPNGTLVGSDDNSAPDARNAQLTYVAASTGMYKVRVWAAAGTGEYVLSAIGVDKMLPALVVTTTAPSDGAILGSSPATITVSFSNAIKPAVTASALKVDALSATAAALVDGNTVAFTIPALSGGPHTASILAGMIADVYGQWAPLSTWQFTIDLIPPRFSDWNISVDSGPDANDKITNDTTPSLIFHFSEPVLGQGSAVIVTDPRGAQLAAGAVTGWGSDTITAACATPLTVNGQYTVTLKGTGGITDRGGNPLNGGTDQVLHFTLLSFPPAVGVEPLVTHDPTPPLLGTVDDPDASVSVTLHGHTYLATNHRNGLWTLADNTVAPLPRGWHDVLVTAVDLAGNIGTDGTGNELFEDLPVVTGFTLAQDTGPSNTDSITSDDTPVLTCHFSNPVFGHDSDVTVLDPNSIPVVPDSIAGWGTQTLVITFSTPLTANGQYTVTLKAANGITDVWGNPLNSGVDQVDHFTLDTTPPQVTQVLLRGTGWSDSFLDYLDSHGLGHPTIPRLGYAIPAGPDQLKTLPWGNIDKIVLAFSENVSVAQGDLALWGVNVSDYVAALGFVPGSFTYDPNTHVATWTLNNWPEAGRTPIEADKLLIDLNADPGGVTDLAGNRLDGEWQNEASTFPSGDGNPGPDFRFRFNVVYGDVNQSGGATSTDLILVRNVLGTRPGDPSYSIWKDVNGTGSITSADLVLVRNHLGSRLPAGELVSAVPLLAFIRQGDPGAGIKIDPSGIALPVSEPITIPGPSSPVAQVDLKPVAQLTPTAQYVVAALPAPQPSTPAPRAQAVDRAISELWLQAAEVLDDTSSLLGGLSRRTKRNALQNRWDRSLVEVSWELAAT